MSHITNLRKFLIRERFVVLKGDYVGHVFHGNQYSEVNAGEHQDMASQHVSTVADLKSEGRSARGRSHGYALDGEMAEAALNAIDHRATAIAKLPALKAEVLQKTKEWQKTYNTQDDPVDYWRTSRYVDYGEVKHQEAEKIKDLVVGIQRIESTPSSSNLGRGWYRNRDANPAELTKVAVSAINRGYKELTGTGKSLLDKNLQPRPEALKTVIADVKSKQVQANAWVKSVNDENADPIERAEALKAIRNGEASNAFASARFLSQVYRIGGDTASADKWMKTANTIGDIAGRADRYGRNASSIPKDVQVSIYTNAAEAKLNASNDEANKLLLSIDPKNLSDADLEKVGKLRESFGKANEYANKASRESSSTEIKADYLQAMSRVGTSSCISIQAISKAASSDTKLTEALGRLGKAGLELVPNINGYGSDQPAMYVEARSAKGAYEQAYNAHLEVAQKASSLQSNLDNLVSATNALTLPLVTDSQRELNKFAQTLANGTGEAKETAKNIQEVASPPIAKAFVETSSHFLDQIKGSLGQTLSGDDATKFSQYSDLAENCADLAKGIYSNRSDAQGVNDTNALLAQIYGYKNIVSANQYAAKGLEVAKNLGKVDTTDASLANHDSYMYKYDRAKRDLQQASSGYENILGRFDRGDSTVATGDIQKIKDYATQQKTAVDTELLRITGIHTKEVVDSAISNGRAAFAEATKNDPDNPRVDFYNAKAQFQLASRAIDDNISTIRSTTVDQSAIKELEDKRATFADDLKATNLAVAKYQRDMHYAL